MIFRHLNNLDISTSFSDCGAFRYQLTVTDLESNGDQVLCVIMQNPSEACDSKADKSVQFLEQLVFKKGYEEFKEIRQMIIVNQFAFIQKKDFDGRSEHIGPENNKVIACAIKQADTVLIAWGKNNRYEERKNSILRILRNSGPKVLLQTRKHPSRGGYKDFVLAVDNFYP